MSRTPATDEERQLLIVLAWMVEQYLGGENEGLDHVCMHAGERAMTLLMEYGLVTEDTRHGRWTEEGKRLLASK